MNYNDYIGCLIGTTKEAYPKYAQDLIIKRLKQMNVVVENNNDPALNDALDISGFSEDEKLIKCIEQRETVVKFIERWEFIKGYKYAVLFSYTDFDLNLLFDDEDNLRFTDSIEEFDELATINWQNRADSFVKPTIYDTEQLLFLKINMRFEAIHPLTGANNKIKYPVVVIFYKELGIMEIRFDRINMYYKNGDTFYKDVINFTLGWLRDKFDIQLQNINLPPIIDNIVETKEDEVVVHAQCMSFREGGKATLEVGNNSDYVLPLLGELKELIREHEEEFNNSPRIKEILEDFIEETEQTSDLPWISLCWKNDVKARQIIVKFLHNYMNEDYTLLQYLGVQRDMGRMNYVTQYLIENRRVG